ncbi:MAG: hypothetical protein ABSC16_02510 [Candidatus Dormibacteria bacterium]|jgi:hypothetical protein|nr:hypothetical protein [Chloroflexota bacterium]
MKIRGRASRYTEAQGREMIALHRAGWSTYRIGKAYGCTQQTAWRMVTGSTHKFRPEPPTVRRRAVALADAPAEHDVAASTQLVVA